MFYKKWKCILWGRDTKLLKVHVLVIIWSPCGIPEIGKRSVYLKLLKLILKKYLE